MAKWIKIDDLLDMAPNQRNLWVVLLSLADSEGRVEVTKPRLCELTGMTMRQVRWQIERLFNDSFSGTFNGSFGRNGKTSITINNINDYVAQRKPSFKSNGSFSGSFNGQYSGSFSGSLPENTVTAPDSQSHVSPTTIQPVVSDREETLSQPHINLPPNTPTVCIPPPSSAPSPSKKIKVRYSELVSMTEGEYEKLLQRFGAEGVAWCIERLDSYKANSKVGAAYKDDYRVICGWVKDEWERKLQKDEEHAARMARANGGKQNAWDVNMAAMQNAADALARKYNQTIFKTDEQ